MIYIIHGSERYEVETQEQATKLVLELNGKQKPEVKNDKPVRGANTEAAK